MSVRHIQSVEHSAKAWCGSDIWLEWAFIDLPHAEGAMRQESLIEPCEECLRKARAADQVTGDRNG